MKMSVIKSLDDKEIIVHLLRDVFANHVGVFNVRAQRLTIQKVVNRINAEGYSFLTKTLPAIGKEFDKTLADVHTFDCLRLRLTPIAVGSKVPKFLGELFERVIHADGTVRKDACLSSIRSIRQICYLFYKYKLPYNHEQEQKVLSDFLKSEQELVEVDQQIKAICATVDCNKDSSFSTLTESPAVSILRGARIFLNRLFEHFDAQGITPRHGPGAVASRDSLWNKYLWRDIPERLSDIYPLDAYFCASLGHVCDSFASWKHLSVREPSARVILVPKDSRGPRLISCEPIAMQWIQQGLQRAIYDHVENHSATKWNVFFTNQQPNQYGALLGSQLSGCYASLSTLDLKEASDRVSWHLVSAIYPERILYALRASRSLSTVLPDGRRVELRKFAPMGSATCFPIMALTIFALLRAGLRWYWDTQHAELLTLASRDLCQAELFLREKELKDWSESRFAEDIKRVYVYGDDIIVPSYFAKAAIATLELFGLRANKSKCCTKGFFRESCGVEAFKGFNVTPLRLRTVWSDIPSANHYTSWIEYTNSLLEKGYINTAKYLAAGLVGIYRTIPSTYDSHQPDAPSYPCINDPSDELELTKIGRKLPKVRVNQHVQRVEKRVLVVKSVSKDEPRPGWHTLLRFFTEKASAGLVRVNPLEWGSTPQSVCTYTPPRTSILVSRWR